MIFPPARFAALIVVAAQPLLSNAQEYPDPYPPPPPVNPDDPNAGVYCCPYDPDNEYFGDCQGCLKYTQYTFWHGIFTEQDCLDYRFFNFPGGDNRRRLHEINEALDGPPLHVITGTDGMQMLGGSTKLLEQHSAWDGRSLQVDDGVSTGYPGFLHYGCDGKRNQVCCCDYTGSGENPFGGPVEEYEYKKCQVSCYFFKRQECNELNDALQEMRDPNFDPRPGDVYPYCPDGGRFRRAKCKAGLGLGGQDPHFETWSGDWYDFMGECDLVFLTTRGSELGPVDIHFRTKIRYFYSFVESAVLRLGEETLEVGGWGQFILNGVNGVAEAGLRATIADNPIVYHQKSPKEHIFEVLLNGGQERIILSTFKDWVTVQIQDATYQNFQGAKGLIGQYPTGQLLGRDGETVFEDHIAFGQEWQVLPTDPKLFEDTHGPQYPQKCRFPDPSTQPQQRLRNNAAYEAAKKACTNTVLYEKHVNACIHDVIASGDIGMAQAGRA